MKEKEFLETILGFSKPWHITEIEQATSEVKITLDYPKGTKFRCPKCGAFCAAYDSKWQKYQHLNLWQYKTILNVRVPRIDCCGHKQTIKGEWLRKGSKFTKMMEMHILEIVKAGMSVSAVAKILRTTDTRLWRVVMYHTDKCRKDADHSTCKSLGIDETSKKGHNYLTSFVDLEKRKIMYIADGKDNKTITEFAIDFELHRGKKKEIKSTTCDMSLAFEKGVRREFENSDIIIDKFHVIKYFNDALNKTLRAEIKSGADLKGTRYLWLKNRQNLTEKQEKKFKSLNKQNGKTAKAYQMKLQMQEIYNLYDKNEAESRLKKLISWLRRSRNEYMKSLANTLLNHFTNIMNYFDNRLTNAILEGLNNVIQNIKHVARGFRNVDYMKAITYLHCGAFEVVVK